VIRHDMQAPVAVRVLLAPTAVLLYLTYTFTIHAGLGCGVDIAISYICEFVCVSVYPRALKGKQHELPTLNLDALSIRSLRSRQFSPLIELPNPNSNPRRSPFVQI